MPMSTLTTLLAMAAGATAAIYVDREFPEYAQKVKLSDTNTLTITPGAMGSAALLLALPFLPGGAGLKLGVAGLAGGAAVYETAKLAEDQILPLLGSPKPATISTTAAVPAMTAGYPRGVPSWQTRATMRHFGRAG